MNECYHCHSKAVFWITAYLKDERIIHEYHCKNCDAKILYEIPNKNKEDKDEWEF